VVDEDEVQYFEIAGLPEVDPDDDVFPVTKKSKLVKFSVEPIKVCNCNKQINILLELKLLFFLDIGQLF
jgi:hypothetical protein